MVARALLRNSVSIDEWLEPTTFVKYCTLKKLSSAIKDKEKMFFSNNYSALDQSFLVSLYLLFHEDFCSSVSNCGSMLFQRLYIDRVGHNKHLLVQIQRQETRKNSELCPKLTIKRIKSRSDFFIVNFE